MVHKYKWMKGEHKELYEGLVEFFGFKNVTELGLYLELNDPYHAIKVMFTARKPNRYLVALLKEKRKDHQRIMKIKKSLQKYQMIYAHIEQAKEKMENSLDKIHAMHQYYRVKKIEDSFFTKTMSKIL